MHSLIHSLNSRTKNGVRRRNRRSATEDRGGMEGRMRGETQEGVEEGEEEDGT